MHCGCLWHYICHQTAWYDGKISQQTKMINNLDCSLELSVNYKEGTTLITWLISSAALGEICHCNTSWILNSNICTHFAKRLTHSAIANMCLNGSKPILKVGYKVNYIYVFPEVTSSVTLLINSPLVNFSSLNCVVLYILLVVRGLVVLLVFVGVGFCVEVVFVVYFFVIDGPGRVDEMIPVVVVGSVVVGFFVVVGIKAGTTPRFACSHVQYKLLLTILQMCSDISPKIYVYQY